MKRFLRFLASIPILIICTAVAESITSGNLKAQGFPVILVGAQVRERLSAEWESDNPYQHERGYCVEYTAERDLTWSGPLIIYTLTRATRAVEAETTPSSISKMSCPAGLASWVFLHTHPPTECEESDNDLSCHVGGEYANQCFPSNVDARTLNGSDKPFALIQCDKFAVVPYWRTTPLPAALLVPSIMHR